MTKVPTVCASSKGGGRDRESISMEPRGIYLGEKLTYIDFEHLFKVGDAIHHVVGPLLLDGDTGTVDASRQLSPRRLQLLSKVLLSSLDPLFCRSGTPITCARARRRRRSGTVFNETLCDSEVTYLLYAVRFGNVHLDVDSLVADGFGDLGALGAVQDIEQGDESAL
jgi:hypothetical protein